LSNGFFQGGLFCVILLISAGSVAAAEDTDATAGTGTGPELVHAFGCGQCHSDDGRILLDGVPRLAGQKYRYLLHQLRLFKAGDAVYNGERIASRHHSVVNELAKKLIDAQLRKIALFYGSRECTAAPAAAEPAPKPPNVIRCESCHGGQRTNPWRDSPYLAGLRYTAVAVPGHAETGKVRRFLSWLGEEAKGSQTSVSTSASECV